MFAAALCAALVIGCGGDSAQPTTSAPDAREPVAEASQAAASRLADRFNEDRAWKLLEYQVKIGPRPAGSPQLKKLATYIQARIPRGRIEAVPGGMMVVPLLAGALIATFFPGTPKLFGSFTGALFSGALTILAVFYVCMGASIDFRATPYIMKKGGTLLVVKVGIAILLPVILGYTAWVYWIFRGKVAADAGYH